MLFKNKCLLTFLALTLSYTCNALPEDQQQPISLEADQAKLNHQTGQAEYQGNVIITQGSAQLTADKVTLYSEDKQIVRMKAFGKPAHYQQTLQAGEEVTHITGNALDLNLKEQTAHVSGQGKVYRGTGLSLTGERIHYSLKTGELMASSDNTSETSTKGRVKMTILPTNNTSPSKSEAAQEN
jgi:lipopolysaccharide export system protein LptA